SWKTVFTSRAYGGWRVTSLPPRRTRPASGRSKPAISRSVVVLPEPEGPSIVKNSPCAISRSTCAIATTSPYVLRRAAQRTSGGRSVRSGAFASAGSGDDKRLLQHVEARLQVVVGDDQRHVQ